MAQLAEFIGNHLVLSLAFMAVFFMYLMILINEKTQAFRNINSSQLTQLVNHKDAIVIDTRSKDDFQKGHIINAINIPLNELSANAGQINKMKGKVAIAYCANGFTSKAVCKFLIKSGIEQVFNLTGGINGWINDKLPVVKK